MRLSERIFTWDNIRSMVEEQDYSFTRSHEVGEKYKEHMKENWDEWESFESFFKHTIFQYPCIEQKITRPTREDPNVTETVIRKHVDDTGPCPGPTVVIRKNNFPYSVESGVMHMLIWTLEELTMEQYQQYANEKYSLEKYETILFENPAKLKSVKKLHHAHLFVRERSTM